MSTHYPEMDGGGRSRRSLVALLALPLLAFAAGLAVMVWLLVSSPKAAELLGVKTPVAAPAPFEQIVAPSPPPAILETPVTSPEADAELNRRIETLERRIGTIDVQARQAVGNADRAESLLIAFAARRALDRGIGLGYLEALLRERFAATQPQAVATIIAASNQPVTLQQLQDQLQELAPQLVEGSPKQSWWSAFKQEFSDLVTIRRSESPSPMPSERLARAQQRLESGQVSIALTELNRLPGRDKAATWFAAARRYIGARDALDRLETAALLEQRQQAAESTPGTG